MSNKVYREIIELVVKASELARTVGIENLLQPGLVKEMIIANILGHELIISKRNADAHDPDDPTILYEYLSCKEGGSGQLDRMFIVESTITWTSWMGEVTNLASGGGGWFAEQLSTYFRALL